MTDAETTEADADQLAAELDRWGFPDYTSPGDFFRDAAVFAALASHEAAVAARGDR